MRPVFGASVIVAVCTLSSLGATVVAANTVSSFALQADAHAQRVADWTEALELDLARSVLEDAEALEGGAVSLRGDGESLALYARALAASGQLAQAREALQGAAQDATGRVDIELELASLDLVEDRLAEVESRLAQDDGKLRPGFEGAPRARFLLGRARVRAGDASAARPQLERFVASAPRHADAPAAWHMLAQEALLRRDLERARECRERGDELGRWHAYYRTRRLQRRANPDAPEPRIGLAQLWIAAEDWDRARAELEPVLKSHPEACTAWTTLGELERKQGRGAESRAAYARAVECDPNEHLARYALALLLLDAGEAQSARAHLEALCASPAGRERRFIGAHLALARALLELGDAKAAEARYEQYRGLGGSEPLEPPK